MIRKMFNRLSFKVFLISFIVQFLSGFLICFVLYSKTPEMMYSPRDELDDLIETLAHTPRAKGGMLNTEAVAEAISAIEDEETQTKLSDLLS